MSKGILPDGWADDPGWREPLAETTGWGPAFDVLYAMGDGETEADADAAVACLWGLLPPPRGQAICAMAEAVCGRGFAGLPDDSRVMEWTDADWLAERAADALGETGAVKIAGAGTRRRAVVAGMPLLKWASVRAMRNAMRVSPTLAAAEAIKEAASKVKTTPPDWLTYREPAKVAAVAKPAGPAVRVRSYADVTPRAVEWLWPDRIALGKLTLLAGDPGLGKSFLTLDMAAAVSTGRAWPDGTVCPLGSVVLLNCEDDPEDTIRPRLDAAGADVKRIAEIQGVEQPGKDRLRGVTLDDVEAIGSAIDVMPGCRLVIIDPVSAFMSDTDSHKNAEVRGLLAAVAKLAQEKRVAVVMVTHLSKGSAGGPAMYRSMGSLAFVAASRGAYMVTRDKDDPARRLFLPIKNNIGNDRTGMAYGIKDGAVKWEEGIVETTADEASSGESRPGPDPEARDDAKEFLRTTLATGGLPATEVYRQAEQAGVSRKTIERAKKELGVTSRKQGFSAGGGWVWELPSVAADQLVKSALAARMEASVISRN